MWCLYFLQGTLYPIGSMLSKAILVVNLIISIYYVLYANTKYKLPPYFKGLNLLLVIFTLYGALLIISGNVFEVDEIGVFSNYIYLKNIYISILPIYSFYCFAKKRLLTDVTIKKWLLIFFVVAIFSYISDRNQGLADTNRDEVTVNAGYLFVSLIPAIVLLYKKPILQYCALAICLLLIIAGMKRGAILIGVILLVYFLYSTFKSSRFSVKILVSFLTIILVIGIVFFINYLIDNNAYFMFRVNQTLSGSSSGRDDIYKYFWHHFINNTDIFSFFFGEGAYGTLKVGTNFAHNDWIEIAINQGLIGVVVYSIYWILFYRTCKSLKNNPHISMMINCVFIICFLKTLFSMSYSDMNFYFTSVLGFALAQKIIYR